MQSFNQQCAVVCIYLCPHKFDNFAISTIQHINNRKSEQTFSFVARVSFIYSIIRCNNTIKCIKRMTPDLRISFCTHEQTMDEMGRQIIERYIYLDRDGIFEEMIHIFDSINESYEHGV